MDQPPQKHGDSKMQIGSLHQTISESAKWGADTDTVLFMGRSEPESFVI